MTYTVKEIFYTLQGEGANAGRPAVFCRFSGCNLWTGREADRADAVCTFCDTDFVGGGPDGGQFATARARATASRTAAGAVTGTSPRTSPLAGSRLTMVSSLAAPELPRETACAEPMGEVLGDVTGIVNGAIVTASGLGG